MCIPPYFYQIDEHAFGRIAVHVLGLRDGNLVQLSSCEQLLGGLHGLVHVLVSVGDGPRVTFDLEKLPLVGVDALLLLDREVPGQWVGPALVQDIFNRLQLLLT